MIPIHLHYLISAGDAMGVRRLHFTDQPFSILGLNKQDLKKNEPKSASIKLEIIFHQIVLSLSILGYS